MQRILIISNTANRSFSYQVKATAVRVLAGYEFISIQISNECDYEQLLKKASQTCHAIFVDLEKKQPINIRNKSNQGGNLFKSFLLAKEKLGESCKVNIFPIKLNDITVSATWKLLVETYKDISGLNLGLVGTGNIGSKLVMILTESGVQLKCFNRDINKNLTVVNSIIQTKPKHTIVSPNVVRCLDHTFINTSGVLLSTSNLDRDISDFFSLVHKEFNIFVIGHSLLSQKTLFSLNEHRNISIKRVDVGKEIIAYVLGTLMSKDYDVFGSKRVGDQTFCSGGFIGSGDELIVDNHKDPKWYYGKCDGKGGIIYENDFNELDNLSILDNFYNE